MKKILSLIVVLVIIFSYACYQLYIKKGYEEIEVLNADVSVSNIKGIVDIKDEIEDKYEEVPLGYSNGNIYLIKCDLVSKKLYDDNIFILNRDGSTKECGIILPDKYLNCRLNVYGDKIFGEDGYFNWQSRKEYKLFIDKEEGSDINWYSVSGNSDFYLCVKSSAQNKKYILYNINNNDKYEFECKNNSEDVINGIFYDDVSRNFYAMCPNTIIKEINISGSNFTLEKYDDIKLLNKNDINQGEKFKNSYIYCSGGQAYIGLDYNDKHQDSININQYDIANKLTEQLDSISLYGYENFYKEYILIKKDDEKSVNKMYLAKLEKNGFDMLIEIPKTYGDESQISIKILNSENVLVKEEKHDKENKVIKNRYVVYDLAEYFQDNKNKLKSDNDKLTLRNTYKNINEYNDSNNKSKLNNENKNVEEVEKANPTQKDTTPRDNFSKDNVSNAVTTEEKDYRERDSSWRKGNGEWYYYKDNDEKVIGWLKTNKGWYYFYKDGTMQKDAIVVGKRGKEYILGHDGLVTNPDSDLEYYNDENKENIDDKKKNNNRNVNNSSSTEEISKASNSTNDKKVVSGNKDIKSKN